MSHQTTFAFMLSLGDSIPDEVRSFVVQIKNVVLEFETLAGSWARQILRQGFVAEMARVEQSVRAGLPLQVDKFIRAAEVVQKYSGPEGPSSIVAGTLTTPRRFVQLFLTLCRCWHFRSRSWWTFFPRAFRCFQRLLPICVSSWSK